MSTLSADNDPSNNTKFPKFLLFPSAMTNVAKYIPRMVKNPKKKYIVPYTLPNLSEEHIWPVHAGIKEITDDVEIPNNTLKAYNKLTVVR